MTTTVSDIRNHNAQRPFISTLGRRILATIRRIRLLRFAIVAGLLGVAVFRLGPTVWYVESEEAVVNAPLLTMRAPFAGTIESIEVPVGTRVAKGQTIAILRDPLANPAFVLDLTTRAATARSRAAAHQAEADGLRGLRAALQKDLELWRTTQAASLVAQKDRAVATLAAANATLAAAETDLARYRALAADGYAAKRTLEQAQRERDTAAPAARGAQADIRRIDEQIKAVDGGISLNDTDRPPTLQRIDEINIRLANLDAERDALEREALALDTERAARSADLDARRRAVLVAPVDGLLRHGFAEPGQRVAGDAPVVDVVDCAQLGITARFAAKHAANITPGRHARVRIAGSDTDLAAHVAGVQGYYEGTSGEARAVVLRPDAEASVLATIELDTPLRNCLVGLPARVRLD
jgi:multidrug resistance efflux pump